MNDDRTPDARARREEDDAVSGWAAAGASLVLAGRQLRRAGSPPATVVGSIAVVGGSAALASAASRLYYTAIGRERLVRRVAGMIAWRGDESVIELGALAGDLAVEIATRLSAGIAIAVVFAGDAGAVAPAILERAAGRAVRARVAVESSAPARLEFDDATLDAVVCVDGLGDLETRARDELCAEIARVLRPGGTAIIVERRTARIARRFERAGLVVERSQPLVRTAGTLRRIVAATRLMS